MANLLDAWDTYGIVFFHSTEKAIESGTLVTSDPQAANLLTSPIKPDMVHNGATWLRIGTGREGCLCRSEVSRKAARHHVKLTHKQL
jgi:hypothetical protein